MTDSQESHPVEPRLSPFRGDFGRRRSSELSRGTDPYKVVSVRLRTAEFAGFEEQTAQAGLTKNLALRIAARRIAGFLETDANTLTLLREISQHIAEISRGLTRLNKACAASGTVDMAELATLRRAFGDEFVRLEDMLRVILNVSMRRQDGLALLKKASAQ